MFIEVPLYAGAIGDAPVSFVEPATAQLIWRQIS
jgi:hypothetical protein